MWIHTQFSLIEQTFGQKSMFPEFDQSYLRWEGWRRLEVDRGCGVGGWERKQGLGVGQGRGGWF